MDLFGTQTAETNRSQMPLAARLRPRCLDEVAGQRHLLAPGRLLRRAIMADRIGSLILYGPPGCGKTSLAEVIAATTSSRFERTSGALGNVAVLRRLLESASLRYRQENKRTLLFIDEIHHFNKSQQDILLPYVEDGSVVLIGATTHNPFFFINSPLTSRSQVFEMKPLSEEDVVTLLRRALENPDGLANIQGICADDNALRHLARVCDGDARRALNALEVAALTTPLSSTDGCRKIDLHVAADSIQKKALVYDRDEDGHYDTISAFIKSIRGSDPHAALYWLAKMLLAGEDPRFIARRLVILASEDIGNADPRGLLMAAATLRTVECIGMPEARITLAQTVTYLACAPKSNAAYLAIEKAMEDVRNGRTLPVPKHLRGTGYRGAKRLGHTGYEYPHDHKGHFIDQEYIPTEAVYYQPADAGYEAIMAQRLAGWSERRSRRGTGGNKPGNSPRNSGSKAKGEAT